MPKIRENTENSLPTYWLKPFPEVDLAASRFEDRYYPQLPKAVRDLLWQSRKAIREVLR